MLNLLLPSRSMKSFTIKTYNLANKFNVSIGAVAKPV